ncbi:hypothetical protein MPER_04427 [Moniliophthora perniciosa FA553]|nr:hypothetical protein MPER_04427 [Moniliophthora perniciosa FA553]
MALQSEYPEPNGSPGKTVQTALELLSSLRSQLLQEGPLQIPLNHLGAFESKKGARVLWVSPKEGEPQDESSEDKAEREKLVRRIHHGYATSQGEHQVIGKFWILTSLPNSLHCTILNTSWRKPSSKRHLLFSFDDVLRSTALADIRVAPQPSIGTQTTVSLETKSSTQGGAEAWTSVEKAIVPGRETLQVVLDEKGTVTSTQTERLVDVDIGTYTVSEIQLCVMGSHGPEDEYVSVGSISLTEM